MPTPLSGLGVGGKEAKASSISYWGCTLLKGRQQHAGRPPVCVRHCKQPSARRRCAWMQHNVHEMHSQAMMGRGAVHPSRTSVSGSSPNIVDRPTQEQQEAVEMGW